MRAKLVYPIPIDELLSSSSSSSSKASLISGITNELLSLNGTTLAVGAVDKVG